MPASATAVRAGRAYVELFTENSRLIRGLNSAKATFQSWGATITGIGARLFAGGALAGGALFGAAKIFAHTGDQLQKMSLRTGVSAEALSTMGFAAEQSGVDLESFENGLRKMQKTITDAAEGSTTAEDSLNRLGIKMADLRGLAPEDQFKMIADQMAKVEDPTTRAGLAMEIFGKSGTKLLPLMADGAAGINALQEEARALGLEMSTNDANAAAELEDALNRAWRTVKSFAVYIGASVAPTLTMLANNMATVAATVSKWISENRGLVTAVGAAVVGIILLGVVGLGLGAILSGIGTVIGILAAGLSALGAVIGFLLSPIGAATAAIVGIGGAVLYFSGLLDYLKGVFGPLFEEISGEALGAFGAIRDALAAGDIAAAAKVLWSLIKLEFQRGAGWVTDLWNSMVAGVASLWIDGTAAMQKAWVNVTTGLSNAWASFTRDVVSLSAPAFAKVEGWISGVLTRLKGGSAESAAAAARMTEAVVNGAAQSFVKSQSDQLALNEQERDKALADIEAMRKSSQEENAQILAGQLSGTQAELAAAKAELQQAMIAAKSGAGGGPGKKTGGPGGLNIPEGLAVRSSVVGTFEGGRLGGLGATGPMEKVAKATQDTATQSKRQTELLGKIAENSENLGFTWG